LKLTLSAVYINGFCELKKKKNIFNFLSAKASKQQQEGQN
jgi:hypothetical protein